MKSSNELLKGMQPGDYVLIKTLGQLVDTEGLSIDTVWFVKNKDVMGVLGKMLPIDSVSVIDGVPFATVSYNNIFPFFLYLLLLVIQLLTFPSLV